MPRNICLAFGRFGSLFLLTSSVSADGVVCLFIYCQVAVHPAAWQYPWHLPFWATKVQLFCDDNEVAVPRTHWGCPALFRGNSSRQSLAVPAAPPADALRASSENAILDQADGQVPA